MMTVMAAIKQKVAHALRTSPKPPLLIGRDATGTPCYLVSPPYGAIPAGARAISLTQYLDHRFDPPAAGRKARIR